MQNSKNNKKISKSTDDSQYEKFDPRSYVAEYYSKLGPENEFLLNFYHSAYKNIKHGARILEFGGGPTIYQLLSASEVASEIVFADFLDSNRREVALWLSKDSSAINWDKYIDYVLKLRSDEELTKEQLRDQVSKKVTRIIECDINLQNILCNFVTPKFDVISTAFCLDSVCNTEEQFIGSLKKLISNLSLDGALLLTSLIGAESYIVGDLRFSCYPVSQERLTAILKDFGFLLRAVETIGAENNQGYDGIIAVEAVLTK